MRAQRFHEVARELGVDCSREFHLLSVVKQACDALGWKRSHAEALVLRSGDSSSSSSAAPSSSSTSQIQDGANGLIAPPSPLTGTSTSSLSSLTKGPIGYDGKGGLGGDIDGLSASHAGPQSRNEGKHTDHNLHSNAKDTLMTDILWFKQLLAEKRHQWLAMQAAKGPAESTPWMKLKTEDGRVFYHNFQDGKYAACLPGTRDREDSNGSDIKGSSLEVMSFVYVPCLYLPTVDLLCSGCCCYNFQKRVI